MMAFIVLVVLCSLATYAASQSCGVSMYQGSRVIGGQNAVHGSWPWQILLLSNGRAGCGGSIISPYWVVTASHCVVDARTNRAKPASSFSVRVGDNDRRRPDLKEATYRVSKVIRHRDFSFQTFLSDVALLKLAQPIQFNNYVKPVCLPNAPARVGTSCYITGWGRVSRYVQYMHYRLQQAQMPVVAPNICAYYMGRISSFPIGAHSICSGYGNARISGCQGDSGGPYVCNIGGKWELHGAVSWGSKQCSNRYNEYTVYANIYNLKPWIEQQMRYN